MVVPIQPGSLDQKKMIRPRWRQILILVIVPLLTGCYVLLNHFIANQRQYVTIVDPGRIVDPKSTGVKKLPGTEDMRIYGEDNFSVSPDGRWLLYYSDTDGTRDLFFVLYDTINQKRHEINLSAMLRSGQHDMEDHLLKSAVGVQMVNVYISPARQIFF